MAKVRRIDWSPDEWIAGTAGLLTQREAAVYMAVLMVIYSRDGRCPNDIDFITQFFKPEGDSKHRQAYSAFTAHTMRALGRLLDLGKLHLSPDGQWLTNERADLELNKAHERINGTVRAGFASGEARRNNPTKHTTTQPRANPLANHYPRTSTSNEINDLTRTPVRIINHHYESSSSSIFTVAARDPAQVGGSGPRASRPQTMRERMAALAALNRRKFLA